MRKIIAVVLALGCKMQLLVLSNIPVMQEFISFSFLVRMDSSVGKLLAYQTALHVLQIGSIGAH